jgi:hypothetical protein
MWAGLLGARLGVLPVDCAGRYRRGGARRAPAAPRDEGSCKRSRRSD